MPSRNDMPDRYRLFRLCDCTRCGSSGKENIGATDGHYVQARCSQCRGEGRIRQEVATCATPEAVGVAIVTLAREGEWEECPFGLLDQFPECEGCGGNGTRDDLDIGVLTVCTKCKGSGVKPTGTWLVRMWLPSPRNVSDAAKLLRKQRT